MAFIAWFCVEAATLLFTARWVKYSEISFSPPSLSFIVRCKMMNPKTRQTLSNPAVYANFGVVSVALSLLCLLLAEVGRHLPRSLKPVLDYLLIAMTPVILVGFLAVPVGIVLLMRRWTTLDVQSRRNLTWTLTISVFCIFLFILPSL